MNEQQTALNKRENKKSVNQTKDKCNITSVHALNM